MGPYEVIEHVVGDMGKPMGKAKGVLESVILLLYFGGEAKFLFTCDTPYRLFHCIMY
jgi:hypothetical protein